MASRKKLCDVQTEDMGLIAIMEDFKTGVSHWFGLDEINATTSWPMPRAP